MILTGTGRATRIAARDVPLQGRSTQGKQLVTPVKGDRVVEVSRAAGTQKKKKKATQENGAGPRNGGRNRRRATGRRLIARETRRRRGRGGEWWRRGSVGARGGPG